MVEQQGDLGAAGCALHFLDAGMVDGCILIGWADRYTISAGIF